LSRELSTDLTRLEAEIAAAAGGTINLNSPKQLATVLFDRLQLPILKRTKTGPSTDADVLEELAEQGHRVPRLLLEFRELQKLRSTYVDVLPQKVHRATGRIHTSFNQIGAATGRLSSSEPNLQNIPVRTPRGEEIRKGFVPEPGWKFVVADYSQIELRLMAHLSQDPAFLEAFRQGEDIHRQTAAIIFGVPLAEVTAEMRAQAARLPAGLEERTRAALAAGDGSRAERGLMIFFAGLVRDLAVEADRRLTDFLVLQTLRTGGIPRTGQIGIRFGF